jgi:hypothetical protein
VLALTLIAALMTAPQGPGPQVTERAPVSAADSARIVRHARSEQTAFESFRRLRLPIGYRSSDPCEIRVGRYCYWRGDEQDDKPPPPEDRSIIERRNSLIRTLDSASRTLRGDAWIVGQTVRYLVEVDSTDAALAAARDCKASASWCHALAGYAAHSGNRFALADSEYNLALAAMEPSERCVWLDISDLLTDELSERYEKSDCAGREALARHALHAGAPLYSVSSTDLFTEHLSRVTRARIAEHSAAADGETWADDVRELMVRYGWPRWYSRTQPDFGSQRAPSIIGHDAGMPYNFIPTLSTLEHVGTTTQNNWHLDEPRAATGYSPTYLKTIHDVPNQIARFRRGDSTLILAAWDARKDTTLIGRPLDAALVIWTSDSTQMVVRHSGVKATGSLLMTTLADSGLISLELLAPAEKRAGRVRIGLAGRDTAALSVSDLLLYSPSPTSASAVALTAVQDDALASNVVPPSRTLGAYWETYGVMGLTEPAHFTLTIEPVDISWFRRVAETLRFADPTRALRIQWQEVPQTVNGIAGRGVRVDVSQLRSGKYRLQLSVETTNGTTSSTSKEIEVR